jgi:hypothetical protein
MPTATVQGSWNEEPEVPESEEVGGGNVEVDEGDD